MRRFGRPFVAIVVAYALLLAPLLGALTFAPGGDLALCLSQDDGVPAKAPSHRECCLLGACHGATPAPVALVALPLPPYRRSHSPSAAPAPVVCPDRLLAASPRGPPPRA
jgi:hypothetical protein